MEVISVVSCLLPLGIFAIDSIARSALLTEAESRKYLPEPFVEVHNLPLDDSTEKITPTWSLPSTPESSGQFEQSMRSRGIRVLVGHDIDRVRDEATCSRLRRCFGLSARTTEDGAMNATELMEPTDTHAAARGYRAIREQWSTSVPTSSWESTTFLVPVNINLRASELSRVRGSKTFQKILIKILRQVWILEDTDNGGLNRKISSITDIEGHSSISNESEIVVVTCRSFQKSETISQMLSEESATAVRGSMKDYARKLQEFRGNYLDLLTDDAVSVSEKRKVLLVWHSQVQLHEWTKLVDTIRKRYTEVRTTLLDSRSFAMRSHLLNEITNDAYIYKELSSNARQLVTTVESLLLSLNSTIPSIASDSLQQRVRAINAETQGLCSNVTFEVDQLTQDLEHHLKFLELRRGVQESGSLWVLSILASVFLPLSLASSILSMQTRFIDLGVLLYDFCGVVVLLITLVAVLIALVRVSIWVQERLADYSPSSHVVKAISTTMFTLAVSTTWALVLSSFIVGMVHDTVLGGRILGFGMAGLAGTILIAAAITCFTYKDILKLAEVLNPIWLRRSVLQHLQFIPR
ncbi:hypothetical protein PG985_015084 [Apiospora marii]|uniref:uncharacterized protein n=1 Tax=Apiospora marii TaxID=335849 RepID=UPI00312FD554